MLIFGQWAEVESLIKELQKIVGIQSVSKGRFFRSPGLAPSFQVWNQIFKSLNLMNLRVHLVCFLISFSINNADQLLN